MASHPAVPRRPQIVEPDIERLCADAQKLREQAAKTIERSKAAVRRSRQLKKVAAPKPKKPAASGA